MAYQPLRLLDSVHAYSLHVFRAGLEPLLQDVHCLLRLPVPSAGLHAGCNFTIAHVLLTAIAGLSAVAYKEGLPDSQAFRELLRVYYPWDKEPETHEPTSARIDALWETFRNPLTHSLGLAFHKTRAGRIFKPNTFDVVINRERQSISEQALEQLERSDVRPDMWPTITASEDIHLLCVEPLYWGVRQLAQRLSLDAGLMAIADRRIANGMAVASARAKNRLRRGSNP